MRLRTLALCVTASALCLLACSSKAAADGAAAVKSTAEGAAQPSAAKADAKTNAKASPATPEPSKQPAKDDTKSAAAPFHNEPAAQALYKQMIAAMRAANSLSYVSHYEIVGNKGFKNDCTYRAWLKKPNYFRVEAEASPAKQKLFQAARAGGGSGILVGDGQKLWIYWPNGRFNYGDDPKTYEKTRLTSYMTKPAPPGGHSIGHETVFLGAGMSMPVIDPSTFFGYSDSLQRYVDGVKGLGTEKVGTIDCDKIEVSIMKHQRSWYLWIARTDHLPRRLRQVVRVSYDLYINEDWSSVTVNGDIPDTMFAWKPPKGWTEWRVPPIEAGLLKPGTKAPDFDLASADGKRIKLSDYRGQMVWFYVWRAG